ncbi:MAG TPA: hypothetical protein VM097_13185 [Mycobacteriales bacterium]|nr:hypothetical protein [Mycobacteriales bacterium]
MHRSLPVALALLLVAPVVSANAGSESSATALCGRGLRAAAQAEGGGVVCSHGPDAIDTGLGLPTDSPAPPAPCIGDGVSGTRIHVLYGVPADVTNDYANKVDDVRAAVDAADASFEGSDGATTQHLRWLCDGTGVVKVENVTLPAIGKDGVFTFSDMYTALTRPRGKKGSTPTFTDPNHVYVTFVDGIDTAYPYCGQGQIENDETPALSNRNNAGPAYSLIACWTGTTTLHEIGHNLGAVQLGAPHSSGAHHCYDEADVMCYDDNGSYFRGPDGTRGTADDGVLTTTCPAASTLLGGPLEDQQFDCGQDDYYNPAPATGSYLSTHWNLANSAWVAR